MLIMRGIKPLTLMEVCDGLVDVDPRADRVTKFEFGELLFAAMIAILCGAVSYKKMAMVAEAKIEWLRRYLPYENGTPSAGTFRDVLSRLNPLHIHEAFAGWAGEALETLRGAGVVAIDGKTAKGTKTSAKKPLHVVSAFASAASLVIGQISCSAKSNEITAIPELLDMLDIHGCLVTIDAMGTQRGIAEQTVRDGGDYLLQVKGNQPMLHGALQDCFAGCVHDDLLPENMDYAVTEEKGHGRTEKRECFLMPGTRWMGGTHEKWPTVRFGALIRSFVTRNGEEPVQSLHYFIGSREDMTAEQCLAAKRQHWSIENQLHWVLDVQFSEDRSKASADHSAENLNALRHIAYNALRQTPGLKGSFSDKQLRCLLDNQVLHDVASTLANSV